MDECVGDEKNDNNNLINDEIEVTCLDVTIPDSMNRGSAEEKYDDDCVVFNLISTPCKPDDI